MTKVAINGFGRIGRAFFRMAAKSVDIEIVAINDLASPDNLVYLLKYDSVYGKYPEEVEERGGALVVGGREIKILCEKDPTKLPWGTLGVDVVVESTGVFETYEKARAHLTGGAKKVVITAPAKDEAPDAATVLMGVNDDKLKTCVITSNASCTTNAASPVLAILHEALGIEKAILNTVHAYTASQSIVDSAAKGDFRRGRAAAVNISPSSTGAAIATTKAITDLAGKFDGIAIRVPVPAGSLVDITFISKRETSPEDVNMILKNAAKTERWKGLFAVTDEPLVSSDIVGSTVAALADLSFTRVVDGNLVKVLAWYDNEMGYAATLVAHVIKAGQSL